MLAATPL
jgi:hypothetical protein